MNSGLSFWIAPEGAAGRKNCHFFAQKSFSLSTLPQSLELKIACESYYVLKVNGRIIGRGPARGSSRIYFYDVWELADCLQEGLNTLRAEVLCMNVPTGRNVPPQAALRVECGDLFGSDASWEMALQDREWPEDPPFYDMQQGFCEWRDLRRGNDIRKVRCAVIPEDSPIHRRKLLPSGIPLPVEQEFPPGESLFPAWVPAADLNDKRIAVLADAEPHFPVPEGLASDLYELTLGGTHEVVLPVPPEHGGLTVIFSFNRQISGRFEVELDSPEGAVLDIAHEEKLFRGDRLRSDHTATNPTYNFSDRYILREGRQTAGNYMVDRGFRMVRLTFRNYEKPIVLRCIRGIDRRYPFSLRSRFFCSDYRLNRLWETARETISACTTDVFTDCPWRERLFFINDFVVENRSALQLSGDRNLLRHAFRMIFSEADENGIIPCVIPNTHSMFIHHGFPKDTTLEYIPSSNLTLPLSLYEYLLYTGDTELIRECYDPLLKMMQTFRQWKNPRGILELPGRYCGISNFFDWSFELNGCQIPSSGSSLMNYLYIIALKAMEQLRLSTGDRGAGFTEEIRSMQTATWHEFYDPADEFLRDCREYVVNQRDLELCGVPDQGRAEIRSSRIAHALALLADDTRKGSELEILKDNLLSEKNFNPELFYGSFVLLAMKKQGLHQAALDYILRFWGPILDSGTPTLWENGVYSSGKAGFGGSASLCHGFSTSPVDFLQTVLLGISPIQPGFSEFRFQPAPCGLSFAHGAVPTPHGPIRVSWKLQDEAIHVELLVPESTLAHTPAGDFGPGNHAFSWKI
ncbi:MAG: hypothetical protein J5944_07570 [Lentisphaeria bacterium]|nr:hypothetical protein [Lentisphaeria bacterium]